MKNLSLIIVLLIPILFFAQNTNVALGKPTTTDSNLSSLYIGSNTVDGDITSDTTRWLSANTPWPHYIEVDLQGNFEIEQLKFWTGSGGYNRPVQYQFEIWNGSTWIIIINGSSNTQAIVDVSFTKVTTSKVRLYGLGGADNYFRLYELEVYGVAASNGSTNGSSTLWSANGSDAYYKDGNIGIGETQSILDHTDQWRVANFLDPKITVYQDRAKHLTNNEGDYQIISSFGGWVGIDNIMWENTYLYRDDSGSDWFKSRLHNGISVDRYLSVPHESDYWQSTLTWWERDPKDDIQAWGNAGTTHMVLNQGNLGIGIDAPTEKLEVDGKIKAKTGEFNNSISNGAIFSDYDDRNEKSRLLSLGVPTGGQGHLLNVFDFPESNLNSKSRAWISFDDRNRETRWRFYADAGGESNLIYYNKEQSEIFKLHEDGNDNVYIHMPKPNSKLGVGIEFNEIPSDYHLAVAGKIISEEVKVQLRQNGAWPDYVFKSNYNLPTLEDVEQHIEEKGHLKDIPSAKEVTENGISLGEMDSKLLQKIEELTLYIIKQNKKQEQLEKRIEELEKQN